MFPDVISQAAIAILATVSVGGVAWVFIYPYLSGDAQAAKRLDKITEGRVGSKKGGKGSIEDVELRRKTVENSLKEIEKRQDNVERNPPLLTRIEQAGLGWSLKTFYIFSAICGLAMAAVGFYITKQPIMALLGGGVTSISFPRWYLNYSRKKRFKKFTEEFPNALDVIVRGVKAGLPLIDCMRICSQESSEPVRSEFKHIMEAQALNVPIPAAVGMLYERVPVTEASFFSIVITVQQKSGGNLSEILSNLAKVLRDRKKMKAKARALAQEAVASAMIIGSLPGAVMLLIYLMNPLYIALLWERQLGQFMLAGAAVWMTIGILVMRKMIDFDF